MHLYRWIAPLALLAASASPETTPAVHDAILKAQASTSQHHYEETIKTLRSLPEDQLKNCYQCELELSVAQNGLGQLKEALESVNRALELSSTPQQKEVAHRMKGSVMLSLAMSDAKFLPNAEAEFRSALEADPKSKIAEFMLGTALLKEKRDEEGVKILKQFIADEPPNSSLHNIAQQLIDQPRRARERFAPDFEVTTAQGEHLSLKGLSGRVLVLDFWATWCPPCRESVPELKELSRKYADKKFTIISISNDEDEKKWQEFIAKKQMTWPQYYDQGRKVSELFHVNAFPTYMVIDGEGAIVTEIRGLDPHQTVAARLKEVLRGMKQLE